MYGMFHSAAQQQGIGTAVVHHRGACVKHHPQTAAAHAALRELLSVNVLVPHAFASAQLSSLLLSENGANWPAAKMITVVLSAL